MAFRFKTYHLTFLLTLAHFCVNAQQQDSTRPKQKYGPNDTIVTPVYNYNGEWLSFREMPDVTVCNCSEESLKKAQAEWTRLRNAVYVTYPYAVAAGKVFNDVNTHIQNMDSRRDRKDYIKTREKELKKEFSDKLQELSVYQGKVLMKLIYRETNNDCYEIIKEMRGGFTARFWQTVAFFFGANLKQEYKPQEDKFDYQISLILKDLESSSWGYYYRNYSYRIAK